MKTTTEMSFKAIVGTDRGIDPARVEGALAILRNAHCEETELVEVIRIKDVCSMLGVSQTTVIKYLNIGLLERVKGAGKWTIGVSKSSYVRFTEYRTHSIDKAKTSPLPPPPLRPSGWVRRRQEREVMKRKIAYALREFKSSPRLQRYLAIESYLKGHPEHSYHLVCEAIGIPYKSYSSFKRTSKRGMTKSAVKRSEILRLARLLVPDKSITVNILHLTREMKKLKCRFSDVTVGRVLKLNGYIVNGHARRVKSHPTR